MMGAPDAGGPAVASISFTSLSRQGRAEVVCQQPSNVSGNAYRAPPTALGFQNFRKTRVQKPPGFLFNKQQQARRWLSGIGVGNGGFIFFGPGGNHAALCGILPACFMRPVRKFFNPDQKKVLVLMSNTGGGHKASAEAIEAGFKQLYGDKYHFDIVDAWKDHTPKPFSSMPDTYSFLVKQPILWRIAYMSQQPRIIHKPYMWSCGNIIGRDINNLFAQYDPDLVISVHPLMQHVPIRVLKRRIRRGLMDPVNFATVVTDFTTCSNLWFHRGASKCFVPTDYAAERARMMGLKDHQIVTHGLPIRPDFAKQHGSLPALRRRLGMDPTLPAVLLVGGGEGMGKLQQTVRAIAGRGVKCQLAVICGRNAALRRQLAEGDWGETVVRAFGFVRNMPEFMAASDAIITKAGPGTIAEALISGLPILLNGNVPCQEEGNIPYVVDNGAGAFERSPTKIAAIIGDWFSEAGEAGRLAMAARAKALGRPDALFKIVRDLAALATHEVAAPAQRAAQQGQLRQQQQFAAAATV